MTLRDFYVAVGHAVTSWQDVELWLEQVFRVVVAGAHDSRAAGAAFYAVVNFRTKLEMTSAAIEFGLDDDWQEKWGTLERSLKGASEQRNWIVHYRLFQEMDDEAIEAAIASGRPLPGEWYVMRSHIFRRMRDRRRGREPNQVTLKDLEDAARTFRETSEALRTFYEELRASGAADPPT